MARVLDKSIDDTTKCKQAFIYLPSFPCPTLKKVISRINALKELRKWVAQSSRKYKGSSIQIVIEQEVGGLNPTHMGGQGIGLSLG